MEQSATPPRVKGKGKAAGTTPKGLGLGEGHEHKAICARALFQADTAGSVATAHIAATPVAPAAAPAAAATAGQAEQQQQAQQQQQQQQQQAALGLLAAALGPLHAFATQLQPQQAVGLVAALNPLVTTAVAALGTLLGGVPQVLPAAGLQLPALGGVPLPPPLPGQLLAALGGQLLLQLAGVPSVPSSVPLPALGGHEDGSPAWPDVLADANLRPGDTPTTSSQAQALVTMTSADAAVVWLHRRAEFIAESQRTRRPVGLAADDVVTGSVPPGELHLVYHVILSRRGGSSEHRLGDMCWSRKGAKQLTAWCKPWGDTNAVRITEEDDEAPCHVQPTGQPAPGFGVPRILRLPTDYDLTELKKSHHVWRLEATYKDDRDWPEPLPEYRAKFAPTASGDSMGNYKIKPQKLDPSDISFPAYYNTVCEGGLRAAEIYRFPVYAKIQKATDHVLCITSEGAHEPHGQKAGNAPVAANVPRARQQLGVGASDEAVNTLSRRLQQGDAGQSRPGDVAEGPELFHRRLAVRLIANGLWLLGAPGPKAVGARKHSFRLKQLSAAEMTTLHKSLRSAVGGLSPLLRPDQDLGSLMGGTSGQAVTTAAIKFCQEVEAAVRRAQAAGESAQGALAALEVPEDVRAAAGAAVEGGGQPTDSHWVGTCSCKER